MFPIIKCFSHYLQKKRIFFIKSIYYTVGVESLFWYLLSNILVTIYIFFKRNSVSRPTLVICSVRNMELSSFEASPHTTIIFLVILPTMSPRAWGWYRFVSTSSSSLLAICPVPNLKAFRNGNFVLISSMFITDLSFPLKILKTRFTAVAGLKQATK